MANKEIIVIYDESDILECGGDIKSFVTKLSKKFLHSNTILGVNNETGTDLCTINLEDGDYRRYIIVFVHESLWSFDFDSAEATYGSTEDRVNVSFNKTIDVCFDKIYEHLPYKNN